MARARQDETAGLLPLQAVFERLRSGWTDYLAWEDEVLFPAIEAVATGRTRGLARNDASARNLRLLMRGAEVEHEVARDAAGAIRDITHGYAPPAGASGALRRIYADLAALDAAVDLHARLERDALFPGAMR